MKYLGAAAILAMGLYFAAGTAPAQHHGGGGHYYGGHHRGGHLLSIHHGIRYGHANWHHVVPHHPAYAGAYFTVGTVHYYTPSPVMPIVPVVVSPGQAAPAPPPVPEVQKPVEVAFGGFSRFEDLAGRLSFAANALCLELHHNYRHNRNFAEVYAEAYGVLQAAKYLHGNAHQGDRAAIARRAGDMDRLFHHVQAETRDWTRGAVRQLGTDTLPEKTEAVEALLHHLCYDVGAKPHDPAAAPPGDLNEAAPPPAPRP